MLLLLFLFFFVLFCCGINNQIKLVNTSTDLIADPSPSSSPLVRGQRGILVHEESHGDNHVGHDHRQAHEPIRFPVFQSDSQAENRHKQTNRLVIAELQRHVEVAHPAEDHHQRQHTQGNLRAGSDSNA